jgi:hypothetical protein
VVQGVDLYAVPRQGPRDGKRIEVSAHEDNRWIGGIQVLRTHVRPIGTVNTLTTLARLNQFPSVSVLRNAVGPVSP